MRLLAFLAIPLFGATALVAQDRVNVPLSNPSQPVTLKVNLVNGFITVTGGGNQVVVESSGASSRRRDTPPPGMHRIDGGGPGLEIEEERNVVTIGSHGAPSSGVTIQTPVNTSVQLKTVNGGHIEVTGINGTIEINNTNGAIVARNVSGSVVAHTTNGSITASLDRVAPDKPMAFTSMNGRVDVTLPGETKARLRLKSGNGSVFSDFDVKLEPDSSGTALERSNDGKGRYRIRMDRGIYGSVNGGGPEYRLESLNGNVLLHKK